MGHSEVMKWFESYFPDFSGERIDMWFPNGRNSIRIRQKNGQEFIFTYHGQKDWKFETITSFLNGMKEKKSKMCEVMNYIFGSLSSSETAIRSIRKSMNKQARYNRKLSTLVLIVTVNLVLLELDRVEQKKRIEKLESTIEEMKCDKGE